MLDFCEEILHYINPLEDAQFHQTTNAARSIPGLPLDTKMQYSTLLALLSAAIPHLAAAAQCKAIHYLTSNTAGGGGGGGGATANNGINVYGADGSMIGQYIPSDTDDPICMHTISIDSTPPYAPYSGKTTCDTLTIESVPPSFY